MSKIIKISSNRDKIIDQLIDDKNRLYLQLKRAEKKIDVHLSQIEHWKIRYNLMKTRLEEKTDEIRNNSAQAGGCSNG